MCSGSGVAALIRATSPKTKGWVSPIIYILADVPNTGHLRVESVFPDLN